MGKKPQDCADLPAAGRLRPLVRVNLRYRGVGERPQVHKADLSYRESRATGANRIGYWD